MGSLPICRASSSRTSVQIPLLHIDIMNSLNDFGFLASWISFRRFRTSFIRVVLDCCASRSFPLIVASSFSFVDCSEAIWLFRLFSSDNNAPIRCFIPTFSVFNISILFFETSNFDVRTLSLALAFFKSSAIDFLFSSTINSFA